VAGPGPAELRAIVGRISTPQLGEQITVPDNSKSLYLPPRQFYALVEKNSDEPLVAVTLHGPAANMTKQMETPIAGAMAHPDLVAFSPRGATAVIYSQAGGRLQVVNNLPAQPLVRTQLSLSSVGIPSRIAVSDDAAVVVIGFADGRLLFSLNGASWRLLPISLTPQDWSFAPNAHDLVISDTAQKMIVLLPNVEDAAGTSRVLAQNVQANHLAFTRDGEELVATNSDVGKMWTVQVKAATVTPREGTVHMETLSPLRDGFTFLLSSSPTVSVLRLSTSQGLPEAASLAQTSNEKH
jgi:hypothetical protein